MCATDNLNDILKMEQLHPHQEINRHADHMHIYLDKTPHNYKILFLSRIITLVYFS